MSRLVLTGARLHDGERERPERCLVIEDGGVAAFTDETGGDAHDLGGGWLAPGLVDAQVNGGGGVMLGNGAADAVRRIAAAHGRLGALHVLPTLVTSTPETTRAVIGEVVAACERGVPGVAGLHLEGPHLSIAKRGAHPAHLIRPMTDADEAALLEAARRLPALLVTLAPESVAPDRIERLAAGGVRVFLGHTDASFEDCMACFAAGAVGATHLYNAMSGPGSRAPGLVTAALEAGVHWGLIADGHHVHPASIRAGLRATRAPGPFLVSDAMEVAGTAADGFEWDGRCIERREGRLTLEDGTLAGADLDLPGAISTMVSRCGVGMAEAIRMATSAPAKAVGRGDLGRLRKGDPADLVHLGDDGTLLGAWRSGAKLT